MCDSSLVAGMEDWKQAISDATQARSFDRRPPDVKRQALQGC